MKKTLNNIANNALMMVPASMNPENQYAKSLAATLAIIVSADHKYEPNEFDSACTYLAQDEFLREQDLTKRAVEYFRIYCRQMDKVMAEGNIDFAATQLELITEVRKVPMEYKAKLQSVITQLLTICDSTEKAAVMKINL